MLFLPIIKIKSLSLFGNTIQDSADSICSCDTDIETSTHFLLHCPKYLNERSIFLNFIRNVDGNIFKKK